jgi:hypothetical protein
MYLLVWLWIDCPQTIRDNSEHAKKWKNQCLFVWLVYYEMCCMLMQWWFRTNMWCSFSSLWFGSGLGHGAGYNRWTTNPWWTQMSICDGSFHHYCPLLLLWPVHPWRMKKPICDGPFRSNKSMTRDTWRFSRLSSWVNCDAFSLVRDETKPSCIGEFLVVNIHV